jgi:hypothetical protein
VEPWEVKKPSTPSYPEDQTSFSSFLINDAENKSISNLPTLLVIDIQESSEIPTLSEEIVSSICDGKCKVMILAQPISKSELANSIWHQITTSKKLIGDQSKFILQTSEDSEFWLHLGMAIGHQQGQIIVFTSNLERYKTIT